MNVDPHCRAAARHERV